jgi:2-dehydro-3-deoxygluconokinase
VTIGTASDEVTIPAEAVAQVVDTTSAGDSFNGAFLGNYVTSRNTSAAARFAAGIAARVICVHGALVPPDMLQPAGAGTAN